jgi:hypothetical protein
VGGGSFSRGSVGGGSYGAVRGGSAGSAYRGGSGYYGGARSLGYGYGRGLRGYGYGGYWPYYAWGYPWYGFGYSYWPGYYSGYYNYYPYDYYYPDTYSDPAYTYSQPAPVATYAPAQGDAYGQTAASGTYAGPVHSVTRSYDEYGQETAPAGGSTANSSPIYLIAQKDGEIQAAASYWITGQTLHYVTLNREEKQVELSSVNHSLTQQLNRERHVTMSLPAQ